MERGLAPQEPVPRNRAYKYALGTLTSISLLAGCAQDSSNYTIAPSEAHVVIDDEGARVSELADRIHSPVVGPETNDIPIEVEQQLAKDAISINNCSGALVRDEQLNILGAVTARHCMAIGYGASFYFNASDSNTNKRYGSGSKVSVPASMVYHDPNHDISYIGLFNHAPNEVKQQMVENLTAANLSSLPNNNQAIGVGFPIYNNSPRTLRFLDLSYAGVARWATGKQDFIATIGTWIDDISCTPGISGGGLYLVVPGKGLLLVGVTHTYAQLEDERTMPYGPEYGLELKTAFENSLGVELQNADYLCGYATPVNISSLTGSRTESVDEHTSDADLSWLEDIWKE